MFGNTDKPIPRYRIFALPKVLLRILRRRRKEESQDSIHMDILSGLTNDANRLTASTCTYLHTYIVSVSQVALLMSLDMYIIPHVREA
jgi:hypothetical protein